MTGASGALGAAAVRALAGQGHSVVMACRNLEKAAAVRDRILAEVPGARMDIRELEMPTICPSR